MMIQYKLGKCTECPDDEPEKPIVKRIVNVGDYCHYHNQQRLNARKSDESTPKYSMQRSKPLKRSPIKYKPRNTGERVIFETIWNTRRHVSFLTGEPINDAYAWSFSHVLRKAKGFWPKFKLYEKNIMLLTRKQHENYDLYVNSPDILLEKDPRWQKVFDLRSELLLEYKEENFA